MAWGAFLLGIGILGACLGAEPQPQPLTAAAGGTGGAGGDGASCTPRVVQVCMRGPEGMWCAEADGTTFGSLRLATDAFPQASWSSPPDVHLTLTTADVNGDGADDLCWREPGGIRCAVADGDGAFESRENSRIWLPFFTDAQMSNLRPSEWATIQLADIDGDGADDVCGRRADGVTCAVADPAHQRFGAATVWSGLFSDADNFGGLAGYWGTIQLADIDGDGDADICGRGVHGVECGRSDGRSSFVEAFEPSWYPDFSGWGWPAFWGTMQLPDLDGDGASDLCARNKAGLLCRLWVVDRFDKLSDWPWTMMENDDGWTEPHRWGSIAFPDVNGDGKADVCARGADGLECGLSDGETFADRTLWQPELTDAAGWAETDRWRTIRYPDLDGDGDADLCARDASGLRCALSDGSAFGPLEVTGLFADDGGWGAAERLPSLMFTQVRAGACPPPASYALPWISHGLPPRYP